MLKVVFASINHKYIRNHNWNLLAILYSPWITLRQFMRRIKKLLLKNFMFIVSPQLLEEIYTPVLLVRDVKACEQTIWPKGHNNNLLHCSSFIFNIWHVCALLCVHLFVISSVYACCSPAYRHTLLTCSLTKDNLWLNYQKWNQTRPKCTCAVNFRPCTLIVKI